MYKFQYDYLKPHYSYNDYDTDSFNVYIKTVDIYNDIAKDVETRFDTSFC